MNLVPEKSLNFENNYLLDRSILGQDDILVEIQNFASGYIQSLLFA